MKKTVYILLVVFSLIACKGKLSPKEYVNKIRSEEMGLVQTLGNENFNFSVQYKPLEYIAIMEQRNNASEETVARRTKELKGLQHYNIKIQSLKGEDVLKSGIQEEKEYYNRLNYLSTFLKQDLYIIQGKDTLSPALYQFERNYGLAPYAVAVVAFEERDSTHKYNKEFIIQDKVFTQQELRLKFNQEQIKKTPTLKF